MTQMTNQEIFKEYQKYANQNNAEMCASRKLGIPQKQIKQAVKQYKKEKADNLVTYRIMKKKRQGLRLVRVVANGQSMDWYTDRDEKGIQEFVKTLRDRMIND